MERKMATVNLTDELTLIKDSLARVIVLNCGRDLAKQVFK